MTTGEGVTHSEEATGRYRGQLHGRAAVDGPARYLGQGRDQVVLSAADPAQLLLLGGEPFGEPILL